MSFDEGFNLDMTSDEDFRAKFSALLDEHGIKLDALCRNIGISCDIALDAINRGTYGLPDTETVLLRLLQPFNLGIDWLLYGSASVVSRQGPELSQTDQRRQLRTLAWDFSIRNNIPKEHRRRLAIYVVGLLEIKPTHTLQQAARPGRPRNMTDMAYHYQRLLREGFFDRP